MNKKDAGGFRYHLEDDKIMAYRKLTTEDKLKWLDDVHSFTMLFQTKEAAALREKLKGDWKKSFR